MAAFLIAGVIILIIIVIMKSGSKKAISIVAKSDLLTHPIYSKYQFNNTDKIINIGTQPLYLPSGLISETMKRDRILRKALLNLGLELKYFPFLKGDDVNFFLKHKALDGGIGGDMPAITAAATMDVVIPVLIQQGFISILARRPMLLAELRGRPIGYAFGSNAHYALLKALSSENLTESEVDLIPMDTPEMADALSSKKVDAFSAWEPTPAIALKKHPDFVVIHRVLTTGYLYYLRPFYEKNQEALLHIIAAVFRSLRWMRNERENLLPKGMVVFRPDFGMALFSGRGLVRTSSLAQTGK